MNKFGPANIPNFPFKKLFTLSESEKEERKSQLECYLQYC